MTSILDGIRGYSFTSIAHHPTIGRTRRNWRPLLAKIVAATSNQDNNPFDVVRGALRNEAVARASKVLNIKPGAFGISVHPPLQAGTR